MTRKARREEISRMLLLAADSLLRAGHYLVTAIRLYALEDDFATIEAAPPSEQPEAATGVHARKP